MIGLLFSVLISLLSLVVARRISRPIENLKQGAERFAGGNLDHRLAQPGTLEIDGLANAMNQMANQLKDRMEAVTNQRNEYETVLSNMLGGVIALDYEQRIISANPAAANILKKNPTAFIGQSIQETIRNRELNKDVFVDYI